MSALFVTIGSTGEMAQFTMGNEKHQCDLHSIMKLAALEKDDVQAPHLSPSTPVTPVTQGSVATPASAVEGPQPQRVPCRPCVGPLATSVEKPSCRRGADWWHSTLWSSCSSLRMQLPTSPVRPMRYESLCSGTAGCCFGLQEFTNGKTFNSDAI